MLGLLGGAAALAAMPGAAWAQRESGDVERLKRRLALVTGVDHFEAQGGRDALVEGSGQLRTIAVSLNKLASDLRWMGSGPSAGLAEIRLGRTLAKHKRALLDCKPSQTSERTDSWRTPSEANGGHWRS